VDFLEKTAKEPMTEQLADQEVAPIKSKRRVGLEIRCSIP